MASLYSGLDYDALKKEAKGFTNPHVVIKINGEDDFTVKNPEIAISQIDVDLSSGFEASVASYRMYGTYDVNTGNFKIKDYGKFFMIGSAVEIAMGYTSSVKTVFVGVITKVNFVFDDLGLPYVAVTAMDVKGLMMANNHSRQLKATTVSDAVKEIFDGEPYGSKTDSSAGIIRGVTVENTPDVLAQMQDTSGKDKPTIEMVGESDYEFVVRMAKKVNFDFFVSAGTVIFRPAKADTLSLMTIRPQNILRTFDVEFDITGLVGQVEVRATDTDTGKLITSKQKINNKWSLGNDAKSLVSNNVMTYLDSTVHSQAEADMRVKYLAESVAYRFGTLRCETVGIPDLIPGSFIMIRGLGEELNNKFYLKKVRHVMTRKGEYRCTLEGCAATLK
ncbi:MAG: phage late control D family protein [Lachnospiraceae bacterium]|nr:phage late control D family protein [Lachnospiraceae bacterium]